MKNAGRNKAKQLGPKLQASSSGKAGHEAFIKGQLRKNNGPGKQGPYQGNAAVVKADYANREHSAFDTQHQSDVNKGGNYRKGKPHSSAYAGSNLKKNYAKGYSHDSYYKGNSLDVGNMTSHSEGGRI